MAAAGRDVTTGVNYWPGENTEELTQGGNDTGGTNSSQKTDPNTLLLPSAQNNPQGLNFTESFWPKGSRRVKQNIKSWLIGAEIHFISQNYDLIKKYKFIAKSHNFKTTYGSIS